MSSSHIGLYCVVMPAGFLIWGVGAANHVHWVVLLLGALLNVYVNVAGGSYAIAYCVDCIPGIASESPVSVILCRNTMSFAVDGITPWIDAGGLQVTLIATAVLAWSIGCSLLLMSWKGKGFRMACMERYGHYVTTQGTGQH
ncbi:hypothetical protein BJX99DRAFT_224427 [Aspergillus californicus]